MTMTLRRTLPLLLVALGCEVAPPEPLSHAVSLSIRSADPPAKPPTMPAEIRVGLLPVYRPEEMRRFYSPLIQHLGHELNTRVDLRVVDNYDALADLVVSKDVDIVQLAPLAYVKAKDRIPDLTLFATQIAEGSTSYSAYLIARPSLHVSKLSDLRGQRFGFVDQTSTSGYLYPMAFLKAAGFDLATQTSSITFAGRHDAVLDLLLAGRIDVGATYSGAIQRARERGLPVEKLSIIAKTGRIPHDAWCARGGLDGALVAQIRGILLGINQRDPAGRKVLEAMHVVNGFTEADDADYDEIRKVLESATAKP